MSAFLPCPSLPPRSPVRLSLRAPRASARSTSVSRRAFMSGLGAFLGTSFHAHVERALAAPVPSVDTLYAIRARLNDIDPLITNAKWDSVRTVLAQHPVRDAKEVCEKMLKENQEDLRGVIVGLREDMLSAIRLLDTSVYANVFVGEDREILGTKVDYDVPRVYLADLKDAVDALIQVAEE